MLSSSRFGSSWMTISLTCNRLLVLLLALGSSSQSLEMCFFALSRSEDLLESSLWEVISLSMSFLLSASQASARALPSVTCCLRSSSTSRDTVFPRRPSRRALFSSMTWSRSWRRSLSSSDSSCCASAPGFASSVSKPGTPPRLLICWQRTVFRALEAWSISPMCLTCASEASSLSSKALLSPSPFSSEPSSLLCFHSLRTRLRCANNSTSRAELCVLKNWKSWSRGMCPRIFFRRVMSSSCVSRLSLILSISSSMASSSSWSLSSRPVSRSRMICLVTRSWYALGLNQ
mmetsp:Transcript_135098/g.376362  ORF Transcript_135098/g.376362 Transcript_135098/m.376362 type:complete len:289 (-) Transcript_135098:491-1357(-)